MDIKSQLSELREGIDQIDEKLIPLFQERMQISQKVADVKGKNNMSILDATREQQVVDKAISMTDESLRGEVALLMRSIMAISREYQHKLLFKSGTQLLPPAREPRKESVTCVYQGVPGAWSEQALVKLFPEAEKQAVEFFEDVFLAVSGKKADYGVVAIENSKTGAIGETYDLLRKYGCYIVGQTWMDIHHCLLAPQGVGVSDIREVFSHPEGFKQCQKFLRNRSWDLTACRNTAVAAQTAAKAENGKTAAIGSRRAGEVNGLQILAPDIMDHADNRTSFVVIASEPEYNEASDTISLTFSTMHRSGALCEALMPFMAHDINLMHIESRPAGQNKYRFFAEIKGNITDPNIVSALEFTSAACDYFEVIGCYGSI